jgi:hypothetical protein
MDETRRGIFRDAAIRRYVDGRAAERDRADLELPRFVETRAVVGLWVALGALALAGFVLALMLVDIA